MNDHGSTIALIVAAGSGSRVGGGTPKQYRSWAGKPVLAHSLAAFTAHPAIDGVRVVIGAGQEAFYAAASAGFELAVAVTGGDTRQQSVRAGLEAIAVDGACRRVLIHDAARPGLPAAVIDRLLDALDRDEGAVPVLAMVDSLAAGGDALGDPVDRTAVVRVQTPQAFRFPAILAAHRSWPDQSVATDDAQVARRAGVSVAMVAGDERLAKLTFEEDFAMTGSAATATSVRTGMGFDVHGFGDGDTVWLGGVAVPHGAGLVGHSDADVLLHAICDALLGAIGEGDIGTHFPPSDPQWRGAPSALFVAHVRDLVARRGGVIDHVDATIICEAPKVGPHRAAIRASIAGMLRLAESRISVKATTTERLGFTGRGEGIAAQAIATVRLPEDS
jgi:2-C-methyl-D-erythritol 4-phosphate cytidylyltransferase/2-C-methyl-D-erythritol 2,4-cyclodiphosphate synthase